MLKKKKAQSIVKQPTLLDPNSRVRKNPKHKSFRLSRKVKSPKPKLPSWWNISKKAFRLLIANKKQVFWFTVMYSLLTLIFVRGFSSPINITELREAFSQITGQETATLASNFTLFGLLLDSSRNVEGETAGLYQLFFITISSLALIWLFRQQQAGNNVTMRTAFYRGMFPLIPFILILLVIGIQLIPALIGNFLFTNVINTGIAVNGFEQTVWLLLFLSLLLFSLYMISSSIIALFVVTIPEMTPMIALKKARELVSLRRFAVLRKSVAIGIFILFLLFIIVLPTIFIVPAIASWLYYILTILAVPYVTAYLFILYRELL